MSYKYTDDDYCDIYENKICDNCGKCLEIDGVNTRAIKIEDIAKTKEENKILEEEFLADLKTSLDEDELNEIDEENLNLTEIYKKFGDDFNRNTDSDLVADYEDAFEHMEYLEDLDLTDDMNIEEMTEEIYPGVRRIKKSNI